MPPTCKCALDRSDPSTRRPAALPRTLRPPHIASAASLCAYIHSIYPARVIASRAMNRLSMGRVFSLGVMLASVGVCHAVRETMAVTEGGITFTVVRYDDGRTNPYRLKFSQGDTRSLYTLNAASQVTNIKVGLETYKVRRCRIPSRKCTSRYSKHEAVSRYDESRSHPYIST